MNSNIKIVEKPEWVSWEAIHEVLWNAHRDNRDHGIVMTLPSIPAEKLKDMFGEGDKILVALDGEKVIGTAAIRVRKFSYWCSGDEDRYAYFCLASLLPEYSGMGIYKAMNIRREELAREMSLTKILVDTHERNQHLLDIIKKAGFKFIGYKYCHDHFNIVAVKWLDGCPYSTFRCKFEFLKSRIWVKLRTSLRKRY